jgi:hypothetical protein
MAVVERFQTITVQSRNEDPSEINSLVNSALSGIDASKVESVNITPVYSTILENNSILQGYIGVILYKTNI